MCLLDRRDTAHAVVDHPDLLVHIPADPGADADGSRCVAVESADAHAETETRTVIAIAPDLRSPVGRRARVGVVRLAERHADLLAREADVDLAGEDGLLHRRGPVGEIRLFRRARL